MKSDPIVATIGAVGLATVGIGYTLRFLDSSTNPSGHRVLIAFGVTLCAINATISLMKLLIDAVRVAGGRR